MWLFKKKTGKPQDRSRCQKSIANGILAGATQIFPQKETESFNLNKVDMEKAKLKTVKDRKPDSKEHH